MGGKVLPVLLCTNNDAARVNKRSKEKMRKVPKKKKIIVLIKQFSTLNDAAAASLILITLWHLLLRTFTVV